MLRRSDVFSRTDRVGLGGRVGYSFQFEDCSSEDAAITFVMDGIFMLEFLSQLYLARYKYVMIDSSHELSLHTDIVMGTIKDIARYRGNDLRIKI